MLELNRKKLKRNAIVIGGGFNFTPIANFISKHGNTIKQAVDIGSSVANLATSTANTVNTIKQIHELTKKKKEIVEGEGISNFMSAGNNFPNNIKNILKQKSIKIVEGSGFKII